MSQRLLETYNCQKVFEGIDNDLKNCYRVPGDIANPLRNYSEDVGNF